MAKELTHKEICARGGRSRGVSLRNGKVPLSGFAAAGVAARIRTKCPKCGRMQESGIAAKNHCPKRRYTRRVK